MIHKDPDHFLGWGGRGLHYDVTRLPCSMSSPSLIYALNKHWSNISTHGLALRQDPTVDKTQNLPARGGGVPAQGFGLCPKRRLWRTLTGQFVPSVVV